MPSQLSSMPLQTSVFGMLTTLQTSLPATQTMVPAWQAPSPLPQASPTPGKVPSSIWPLQLSSLPLQTSICGVPAGASQVVSVPLALQTRTPSRLQEPIWPLLHLVPTAPLAQLPLSTRPSQSSSRPLQISGGSLPPQGPPHLLGFRPSSIWPLQLSSIQLQVSIAQWRAGWPFRAATLSGSLTSSGLMTKLPQAGMLLPATQLRQSFDTPSSICWLQLSSLPLHISPGGTFCAMMPTNADLTAVVSVSVTKMAWPVPPAAAIRLAAAFSGLVRPLSVRM